MKRFSKIFILVCGLALLTMSAAFPVFGQTGKEKEFVFNPQPLRDLGFYVKDLIERGEIDLNQEFKITAEIVLTDDGQTKQPKSKYIVTEGDDRAITIAKTALEAVGNSGAFFYLKNLGADKFKITLAQDKEKVTGSIETELATAEKAKTMASGLNALLAAALKYERFTTDEKEVFGGFKTVAANEKAVMINFSLSVAKAQELIRRNLPKAIPAETW